MIKAPPAPSERLVVRKRHEPAIVFTAPAKLFPSKKTLAIIQTGALGDIINVLPVAKAIYDESKVKTPLVVADRYKYVFDRISYVAPIVWHGNDSDVKGTSALFGPEYNPVVCMGWTRLSEQRRTNNFLKEHWAWLGREKDWGKLPLVFDRRNIAEEEKVLEFFSDKTQAPFILMCLSGNTSPVPDKEWVRRAVFKAASGMPVVDITEFRCKNPIDLISLMESATLFVAADSSPVHINRATKTPAILLGRPVENRWYLSEFIENIKATFTYDTLSQKEDEFCQSISRLIGNASSSAAVVTGFDEEFRDVGGVCYNSIERSAPKAARKTFEIFTATDKHPAWNKVGAILRQLSYSTPGNWVIWLDADCIVNQWPPFDQFLAQTKADTVFTKDWNGICTGIWAVKNCPWSVNFLNALLLCGDVTDHTDPRFSPDGPKWEQNTVKALLKDFPELMAHADFFPQAWSSDKPELDSQKRFAIHHFGTGTAEQKLNRMRCVSPDVPRVLPNISRQPLKPVTPDQPPQHGDPQRFTLNNAKYLECGGIVKYADDRRVFSEEGGLNTVDSSRFDFMCLCADMINQDGVQGDFLELGVYKGQTAAVLGRLAQRLGRSIYLLDTFRGFDRGDLVGTDATVRPEFEDSSLLDVQKKMAAAGVYGAKFIQGRFPETASQIPDEARFALVHLDCDLEKPTLEALQFFYPRMEPGGFILIHDYLSLYWPGLQNAVNVFRKTIPEGIVPVPDASGTVVIRKGNQVG